MLGKAPEQLDELVRNSCLKTVTPELAVVV